MTTRIVPGAREDSLADSRSAPSWRPDFEAFMAEVRARCEAGAEAYGDRSFTRPPSELLAEVAEELADVCGWSFVLWRRVAGMIAEARGEVTK